MSAPTCSSRDDLCRCGHARWWHHNIGGSCNHCKPTGISSHVTGCGCAQFEDRQ